MSPSTIKELNIAIYPGDGIGPEVMDQTLRVLEAVEQSDRTFALKTTQLPWGAMHHKDHGVVAPADYLEILRPFDAILLGALGYPQILPDHVTLEPLIRLRQQFDLFACVRPAILFDGVRSPLADSGPIDMIIVRENSEGEYINCGGRFKPGDEGEIALQTAVHTAKGVRRVLHFGFELARTRRGA